MGKNRDVEDKYGRKSTATSSNESKVEKRRKKKKYNESIETLGNSSSNSQSSGTQLSQKIKMPTLSLESMNDLLFKLDQIMKEDQLNSKGTDETKTQECSNEINDEKEDVSTTASPIINETLITEISPSTKKSKKKKSKKKREDNHSDVLPDESKQVACDKKSQVLIESDSIKDVSSTQSNQIVTKDENKSTSETVNEKKRKTTTDLNPKCKKKRNDTDEDGDICQEEVTLAEKIKFENHYDNEKIAEMVKKLQKNDFEFPWKLPLIHKIVHTVSRGPTSDQRKSLINAGIEVKLGKYTKEEDEKIIGNWKLFCKYYNWNEKNVEPFLTPDCLPKDILYTFVKFISHNFEDRFMSNIFIRFNRLFSKKRQQQFTPDEDKLILDYVKNSGAKYPFADLSNKLKRSRIAVLKRYQKLADVSRSYTSKLKWDRNLTKELLMNILEVTGSKNIDSLKGRYIPPKKWKIISKNMDIPFDKIQRFWDEILYTRVFNLDYNEEFNSVRFDLIKSLSRKYNDWREINWQEEANKFNSFTPRGLYKLFFTLVQNKVPKEHQKNLKDCLSYLENLPPQEKSRKSDRYKFLQELLEEIEMGEDN